MKIKVIGPGCAKCNKLYKDTVEVVNENGIDAEVEHATDITELIKYQVISTPAFIIDEKVVSAGRTLSKKEILQYITERP